MGLHADTSDAPNFLRITISGDWPSFEDRAAFRRQLISDGHLNNETRMLIDLRGLESLPASTEIDAIVSASRAGGGPSRLHAYVATTVDQIVVARMLKQSAGPGTLVEVFKDDQDAVTWLWNAHPDW